MSQPVTTNPAVIALINMSMVFVVLFAVSGVIRLVSLLDSHRKNS